MQTSLELFSRSVDSVQVDHCIPKYQNSTGVKFPIVAPGWLARTYRTVRVLIELYAGLNTRWLMYWKIERQAGLGNILAKKVLAERWSAIIMSFLHSYYLIQRLVYNGPVH